MNKSRAAVPLSEMALWNKPLARGDKTCEKARTSMTSSVFSPGILGFSISSGHWGHFESPCAKSVPVQPLATAQLCKVLWQRWQGWGAQGLSLPCPLLPGPPSSTLQGRYRWDVPKAGWLCCRRAGKSFWPREAGMCMPGTRKPGWAV